MVLSENDLVKMISESNNVFNGIRKELSDLQKRELFAALDQFASQIEVLNVRSLADLMKYEVSLVQAAVREYCELRGYDIEIAEIREGMNIQKSGNRKKDAFTVFENQQRVNMTQLAKDLGVSRTTCYRYKEQYDKVKAEQNH